MLKKLFIKFMPERYGYSPLRAKLFGYTFVIVSMGIFLLIFFSVREESTTEDKLYGIKFIGGAIIFTIIWSELSDYFGKKRHKSILYSKKIKQLNSIYGLEIESLNHSNYWGYKGEYKDYFFRIYYDWSAGIKKNGIRFCFMLHYKPLIIEKDFYDGERMYMLNKKYNKGNTYNYEIKFNASYLIIYMRYNYFTEFEEFKRKLDLAIKIAIEENLMSNSEKEVDILLSDKEFQLLHAPNIDTFYE